MAVMTTGTIPKSLWPGVNAWWGRFYNEHKKEYTDLFDSETSRKYKEEDAGVSGFGLAPVKAQGVGVSYDAESALYTATYTHVTYGLGYIVTMEEMKFNQYMEVGKRRTQALSFSMNQTKEIVAANVYNRATNGSYTGGDGSVLCVTTHSTNSGSQSNIMSPAADLSETALEDLIIQIMTAKNDRGLRIALIPQSLIVPPQLWFEANRIMKSTLQNDTANNAVNALRITGALPQGIKTNHYLSDTDAFFVRTNAPRGMIHYTAMPLEFSQDNDFDTENFRAKALEIYSFGWTDWRGLYMSAGA